MTLQGTQKKPEVDVLCEGFTWQTSLGLLRAAQRPDDMSIVPSTDKCHQRNGACGRQKDNGTQNNNDVQVWSLCAHGTQKRNKGSQVENNDSWVECFELQCQLQVFIFC